MSSTAENSSEPPTTTYTFREPWPDFIDGLIYTDTIRPSDSGLALIEFYSSKHKNSAPLQGWLQRIQNGQIKVDGVIVTDPDKILRAGSELVYYRLPWKKPIRHPCWRLYLKMRI